MELVYDETRTENVAFEGADFAFNAGASGEIVVGAKNLPANAIALYTKSK
jgi:hypothetical protein